MGAVEMIAQNNGMAAKQAAVMETEEANSYNE